MGDKCRNSPCLKKIISVFVHNFASGHRFLTTVYLMVGESSCRMVKFSSCRTANYISSCVTLFLFFNFWHSLYDKKVLGQLIILLYIFFHLPLFFHRNNTHLKVFICSSSFIFHIGGMGGVLFCRCSFNSTLAWSTSRHG